MRIFFLGAEQPVNVRTLLDNGASAVGLSYSALVRRSGGTPKTPLAERFPDEHSLLLDSGGYAANSRADSRSRGDWETYSNNYAEFVVANIERCTYITEFDFLALGPDHLEEMRRGVWKDVADAGKFLPVWHPEYGVAALEITAERFGRIAVVGNVFAQPGQTVATQLVRLARRGIEVHGLGLTKMDVCEKIPFTAVSSTSWISPQKDGDAIVFDGRSLHRYPRSYAESGRKRHVRWVEENGLDAGKWLAGDKQESLAVGIKSWLAWSEALTIRHGQTPQPSNVADSTQDGETGAVLPFPVTRSAPVQRELVDLPLFNFHEQDDPDEEGKRELLPMLAERTVRECDSCFLAPGHGAGASRGCPSFQPQAACAYKFPIKVETKGERRAVANGTLAMQFQRVAFMRMKEELDGGLVDPNTSQEMDRLIKMMATIAEIEDDRDFFEVSMRGRVAPGSGGGVLSKLFGSQVGREASATDRPLSAVQTDRIIEGSFVPD